MDFPTSGLAVLMMAAAVGANAQFLPDPSNRDRAVFFSGEVVLENGASPSDPVLIQRVCKGSPEDEGWTDSKGRFHFKVEVGGNDTSTADAAQPAAQDPEVTRPFGNSTYYSTPVTAALRDCMVQAVLAGYWSDRVSIAVKNTLDDTRIGKIVLHPMTHGQTLTVSATTLAAPGNARKAYDKGLAAMRERRWDAAAGEFKKAVAAYPKFAVAWYELGQVRQSRNDVSGAADAWKEALKADPKYVMPYESLAALAERQQNWADSEKYSRDWIHLAPEDFPPAYLYNAVANAQLNHMEQAETSVREGLRIDKERKFPRLSYVLGLILMQKHAYGESAKCLRTYLELAPNAKDAAAVRQELTKLEAAATGPQR